MEIIAVLHETSIRNVSDCDDYWSENDEMGRMFDEDGPYDGFDWTFED